MKLQLTCKATRFLQLSKGTVPYKSLSESINFLRERLQIVPVRLFWETDRMDRLDNRLNKLGS